MRQCKEEGEDLTTKIGLNCCIHCRTCRGFIKLSCTWDWSCRFMDTIDIPNASFPTISILPADIKTSDDDAALSRAHHNIINLRLLALSILHNLKKCDRYNIPRFMSTKSIHLLLLGSCPRGGWLFACYYLFEGRGRAECVKHAFRDQ